MTRALRVVVGDDGSDHADAAVAWAADRADEAGGRLRVVRAVSVPVVAGLGWKVDAAYEAGRLLQAVQASGRAHLSHRRRELSAAHPDLEVETALAPGDPRPVLLAEAETADLLVLGARGLGPVRGLLLGSVSAWLARLAPCPTVVLHGPDVEAHGLQLAARAGDDPAAIRFACAWAATHGQDLVVLREPDARAATGIGESAAWLDAELALQRRRHPEITVSVVDAPAADLDWLVQRSGSSALLVVERGHNARRHDDALWLAEHSRCPVAVVPCRAT